MIRAKYRADFPMQPETKEPIIKGESFTCASLMSVRSITVNPFRLWHRRTERRLPSTALPPLLRRLFPRRRRRTKSSTRAAAAARPHRQGERRRDPARAARTPDADHGLACPLLLLRYRARVGAHSWPHSRMYRRSTCAARAFADGCCFSAAAPRWGRGSVRGSLRYPVNGTVLVT